MNTVIKLFTLLLLLTPAFSCATDTTPPKVVSTIPVNGDTSVDPSQSSLSVTFNEPMQDGTWSWAYTRKEDFPEMTGQPKYVANNTENVLPVKLVSNKNYEIWINSSRFKNFKDKAGNSAKPYKLVFKTK